MGYAALTQPTLARYQALLSSVCTRSSASLTRQAELGWWHYQTELGNEQCFAGGLLAADRTFDNQDKLQ